MALSDTKIRNLKSREKIYKIADEKGLYLQINPSNSKYWRFKFRFAGKEKKLALGVYPDVSLADARKKRDEARKLLSNEIDPSLYKKEKKRSLKLAAENSFENVALEWHTKFSSKWTQNHGERILQRFKNDVFPWIGNRPISEINAPELLSALRRIESRGAIETAHRTHQNCGQIFHYAIATGRAERDIRFICHFTTLITTYR